MFLKTTRSGKYEYVQVVESIRLGKRTTHKVRLNLGRKDEIVNDPDWQSLAKKLAVLTGLEAPQPKKNSILDDIDVGEGVVLNWGYLAYKKLWTSLGLDVEMNLLQAKTKASFPLANAVFLMVLHHLLSPGSKLDAYGNQAGYASFEPVELHHLYRALDYLCEYKEALEEGLFAKNYSLLNSEIDVVFYDVTTFAFESVKSDELRDFGFSKDNKFGEVQVVMGMFIDRNGCPVGYELFSGNTFDGKTLVTSLSSLKERFGIRRVIVVADRGINSKLNLLALSEAGYGYIVASRLKNMPKDIKEQALDVSGYQALAWETEDGEVVIRAKQIPYKNVIKSGSRVLGSLDEQLVITHSVKRASKDAADRERLLQKARKLLENPATLKGQLKRGGRKFLKVEGSSETTYIMDAAAIEKDAMWDGLYAIQTSEQDMPPSKILEAYHTLWKIEESFRIMKSALEVRPIYHWTPDRIKGHFVVCFLAFLMERRMEQRLMNNNIEATPLGIRAALNKLTVTKTTLNEEVIYIKSAVPSLAGQILRMLRIKQPTTLLTESGWNNWIREK